MKMLTNAIAIRNSLAKLAALFVLVACSSVSSASDSIDESTNEELYKTFESFSRLIGDDYSIASIREKYLSNGEDYLLIGGMNPEPKGVHILLVVNNEKSKYLHLSSKYNRKVECISNDHLFDVLWADHSRLSSIKNTIHAVNRYYTIVERRLYGRVSQYAFSSYDNQGLRLAVDELQTVILTSMLNHCSDLTINKAVK